jgi:hypothetical protein
MLTNTIVGGLMQLFSMLKPSCARQSVFDAAKSFVFQAEA